MMTKCQIIECDNEADIKDFCLFHYNKQYYYNNKDNILQQKKTYSSSHKIEKKNYDTKYRIKNKEKLKKDKHDYWISNIDSLRIYHRNYRKNRFLKDPIYKLRKLVSRTVQKAIKGNNSSKNNKSFSKYLNYSIKELKEHLEKQFEPWMSWSNHGNFNSKTWNDNDSSTWTWQIDHIIPQSKLLYLSMEDDNFKKCWSLDNLRPLSAKQNLSKSDN